MSGVLRTPAGGAADNSDHGICYLCGAAMATGMIAKSDMLMGVIYVAANTSSWEHRGMAR